MKVAETRETHGIRLEAGCGVDGMTEHDVTLLHRACGICDKGVRSTVRTSNFELHRKSGLVLVVIKCHGSGNINLKFSNGSAELGVAYATSVLSAERAADVRRYGGTEVGGSYGVGQGPCEVF